jgi:hypothetical protein
MAPCAKDIAETKRRKTPKMMKEHLELAKMYLGASISLRILMLEVDNAVRSKRDKRVFL